MSLGTLERVEMYASLLLSFIRTGLRSAPFWVLACALAGLSFLSRTAHGKTDEITHAVAEEEQSARLTEDKEGRLTWNLVAFGFAFALAACVVYLLLTSSLNARYVAFLLLYGAATLAWTKGRAATFALASLLLLQSAVAAALPVHMRDIESVVKGQAEVTFADGSDLYSVNGRLTRGSWGKRFLVNHEPVDLLKQPLNSRACRYAAPCEECK